MSADQTVEQMFEERRRRTLEWLKKIIEAERFVPEEFGMRGSPGFIGTGVHGEDRAPGYRYRGR